MVRADRLMRLCVDVLEAAGTPEGEARKVAGVVVSAYLGGVDSHGVRNMPWYVRAIRESAIVPRAEAYSTSPSIPPRSLRWTRSFGRTC